MKDQLLIILAVALVALAIFFTNNYLALRRTRKENQRLKLVNEFFFDLTSNHGPSLGLLVKTDLDILQGLESRIRSYYRKNFFALITKSIIEEIEPYIKAINELPDSPQKDFVKTVLKKEIFSSQDPDLKDLIFRTIKLSNTTNSYYGPVLKKFLFTDLAFLKEQERRLTTILNQCQQLFEKIDTDEDVKALMINDFEKLIKNINQQKM